MRDASKVAGFLGDKVELFEADLNDSQQTAPLEAALDGAQAVVICTGTTAFPTRAWSADGEQDVTVPVLKVTQPTDCR